MTSNGTAVTPQFMRALELANRVRLARAELKAHVARGELPAGEVVLSCPTETKSMAITELLLAQRSWGPARCRRFLLAVPLREDKTLGSMTERQRRAVAERLSVAGACRPERRPRASEPGSQPAGPTVTLPMAATEPTPRGAALRRT